MMCDKCKQILEDVNELGSYIIWYDNYGRLDKVETLEADASRLVDKLDNCDCADNQNKT